MFWWESRFLTVDQVEQTQAAFGRLRRKRSTGTCSQNISPNGLTPRKPFFTVCLIFQRKLKVTNSSLYRPLYINK